MSLPFKPELGNRFQSYDLDQEELNIVFKSLPPIMLAYLQNKIAAYASALVDAQLPYNADPTAQVEAIIARERLRNFVDAYEELMGEILSSQQPPSQHS